MIAIPPCAEQQLDRLSAQFAMHHEHCGDPPVSVATAFTRNLETQQQPYVRRCRINQQGMDLDTGWLGQAGAVGYVVIQNKLRLKPNSSKEEREKHFKQIVYLTTQEPGGPSWQIRPGGLFVGEPHGSDHFQFRLWAADEPVDITITVMPL